MKSESLGKLLIVDDEKELVAITKKYFEYEKFAVEVAYSGCEALQVLDDTFDLLILDISMPNMDGIEVCRRVRQTYNLPIIFLTAKAEEGDMIQGLTSGADDYITKPVTLPVLMSHVKAAIRRYRNLFPTNHCLFFTSINFRFDRLRYVVYYRNTRIPLTKIEFSILLYLAENSHEVKSLCDIYENVWEEQFCKCYTNNVMVHINNIKNKLLKHIGTDRFVKNIWGKGYKFEDFF
ncbi:MAG TPA: response regulator transcription factor [Caldisericia bacterium]|nr:response regulator transcription factor [Caldisericia bacterium]HXK51377.1 response regulator transcription factor [Caldisericia bacterium]